MFAGLIKQTELGVGFTNGACIIYCITTNNL